MCGGPNSGRGGRDVDRPVTLADGGEAFAKALVLGGVTKRFPAW